MGLLVLAIRHGIRGHGAVKVNIELRRAVVPAPSTSPTPSASSFLARPAVVSSSHTPFFIYVFS